LELLDHELSAQRIQEQLIEITHRMPVLPGKRQVPFTAVEKVCCYGLFFLCNPHRYGGANMHTVPESVKQLATFFRRSPDSLINKMLNLEGSRLHSAREEPELFATFAAHPDLYHHLYREILIQARTLSIGENLFPDYLQLLSEGVDQGDRLIGQDDLPESAALLLAGEEETIHTLQHTFSLGDRLTEKLVERKIRLAQHRFAREVIRNCGDACVFCGFAPSLLLEPSQLLRASHIKPWAVSTHRERVDVRNGVAACPMHDAAFDRGYLMINGGYRIHRAHLLEQSIVHDPKVTTYFGDVLSPVLLLPQHAQRPGDSYLSYHREHIFKG
jgi:putative restriction endonuclease